LIFFRFSEKSIGAGNNSVSGIALLRTTTGNLPDAEKLFQEEGETPPAEAPPAESPPAEAPAAPEGGTVETTTAPDQGTKPKPKKNSANMLALQWSVLLIALMGMGNLVV
jgi:cell division septation protein DedD